MEKYGWRTVKASSVPSSWVPNSYLLPGRSISIPTPRSCRISLEAQSEGEIPRLLTIRTVLL